MGTEVSHHYSWRDTYRGMSSDNIKGLVLALSSSVFIGASFIIKKKGLKKSGVSGVRAGLSLAPLPQFYSFIEIICLFRLYCVYLFGLMYLWCLSMCVTDVDLIVCATL